MAILDFRYNHWTDMESCGNPYKQAYKKEMAAVCSVFLVLFPLIWILNTLLSLIGHNEG